MKLPTLQQLLLMFCGTTKIKNLCLELQNSLMLNQQVDEECSLVLSNSIFTENICPHTYAGFLLYHIMHSVIRKKKLVLYSKLCLLIGYSFIESLIRSVKPTLYMKQKVDNVILHCGHPACIYFCVQLSKKHYHSSNITKPNAEM